MSLDTQTWQLVGGHAAVPPSQVRYIGVTAAGWAIEYSPAGGPSVNSIADAENDLMGAPIVSNVPLIAYIDPESPNAGLTCWLPFPSETAADDDHFAIRGTAQLVIPTDGV